VMGVPAHDQRDFPFFARASTKLPVKRVMCLRVPAKRLRRRRLDRGPGAGSSGPFDGLEASRPRNRIVSPAEAKGWGRQGELVACADLA